MRSSSSMAWSKRLDRATLALAWLAALGLLFLVAMIAFGVLLRYVFAIPILGANEIVELAAVVVVMAALPYCTAERAHVGVDVFDPMLGRWGRLAGDVLSRLLSGFVLGVLVWRAVLKAIDAWRWGDATNMLSMPIWPFYAVLAAGAALCVVVFAMQIVIAVAAGEAA
ncbi:TRAP transporter small permease [Pararhizobium mangrovi]|uniref:TRAP transporter small permease protein n=1 Tax=Pararhizobium mangrovi TaxID=2590452 RepID=A0A506U155_9HYPH|nr:TRAP transporter small permease [Pararhizobium mangrovi]TPW26704.1 TRAP transporter small permease [Pararhizobium mangrovi]